MILRCMLVAMLVAGVAGCASVESTGGAGGASQVSVETFAHRVASPYLILYWNCARPSPDLLRLEGVARNQWSAAEVRSVAFELVGVNARDRTVSAVSGEARDFVIRTGGASPFLLSLRPVGGEARFDLYYQYQFSGGEQMDALLAGPPMPPPKLLAQVDRYLIRDVCSESLHRAR
ncbi:MAG TPA: hypothetical protein VLT62_09130 [Candidatus Methylomirabilis sp.]|nr:hypothetical protein [Candidatus Methylomirabilis sp.]